MPVAGDDPSLFVSQLDELIAGYLQTARSGETPDRNQILSANPQFDNELQEFFADHDWMHELAGEPFFPDEEQSLSDSKSGLGTTVIGWAETCLSHPVIPAGRNTVQPVTFGEYELLREIGRGGMGVIYKARQRSLNRLVALKMIRSSQLASQGEIDRFHTEAELAAGLDHPGIVPIHEVGEVGGQHYYSMAFVDGQSLGDWLLKEQVLNPLIAAELVKRVAEAISYAHLRGVIHRDLKPANILLAPSPTQSGVLLTIEGTTQNYDPKVTDFGLAKRAESDSGLTGTGQILGTPSYMPPEQAAGNMVDVGPLADVYSLGAVLYCLLTGRPPFRAANVLETLKQVLHDEPVAPRQLNSAIPRDLETICLKCLNKTAARRYGSALELAKDLQRFLHGEPVLARPTRSWERAWKWVKRRPTVASLVVVAVIAALAMVGWGVSYVYQVEREQLLYSLCMLSVYDLWRNKELELAQSLLEESEVHLRGWEWDHLDRLTRTKELKTLDGNRYVSAASRYGMYSGLGVDVEFDRTGRYIAASVGRGPVLIWDLTSAASPIKLEGHAKKVQGLAFSPAEELLATAGSDGAVKVWRFRDQLCLHSFRGAEGVPNCVSFSPDGQFLASGAEDGFMRLWHLPDGGSELASTQTSSAVKNLQFSPDGRLVAAACADGTVRLLNSADLSLVDSLPVSTQVVYGLAFIHEGTRLAAGGKQGKIHIWDVSQRREVLFCEGHTSGVSSLAYSPARDRLFSVGGYDKTVRIWDAATGRLMQSINPDPDSGTIRDFGQITCDPDGQRVATTSDDNLVRIWDVGNFREALVVQGHASPVCCVAFRADGRMASGGDDGSVKIWEPKSEKLLQEIKAHTSPVNALAFSPDGQHIATGSQDRSVKLWNPETGNLAWQGFVHEGEVYAIAFSPDGKALVSTGHDGQIVLWDAASGKNLGTVEYKTESGITSPASCVACSPDGNQVAVGGWDGGVALFSKERSTLHPAKVLPGHEREVYCVAYSRDGRYLASGDRDGRIIVWDVARRRAIAHLPDAATPHAGHVGPVSGVLFSTAGNRVMSTGWDGVVHVWDVDSHQVTLALNGRHGRTYCLALSPDDTSLASGNHDGTILLWGL